jgi:broad specificity phosphatase PhoE
VLVRHCATEWSAAGKHTSHTDIGLSDIGRLQLGQVASQLRDRTFAAVFCSPRRRARETCTGAGFEHRATIDDDLVEWDYGHYEGRTTAEIRADRPQWSLWTDGTPGGETPEAVARRADRWIEHASPTDAAVLVISHGHFLRVLAARWLDLPPSEGRLFGLDPGGISCLGYERDQRVIRKWNQTPSMPLT